MKSYPLHEIVDIQNEAQKRMRKTMTVAEAAHYRAVREKPDKLAKYDGIIGHVLFKKTLKTLKPQAQKVIYSYLKRNETWKTVADKCGISAAEAQRYFHEGMAKIAKQMNPSHMKPEDLRKMRLESGLSIPEFAAAAGCSPRMIRYYESGEQPIDRMAENSFRYLLLTVGK